MLVEGIGIPKCNKNIAIHVTDKLNIWLYVVHHTMKNKKTANKTLRNESMDCIHFKQSNV